jgi:hypothetical protein
MGTDGRTFEQWVDGAGIPERYRCPRQLAVLEAVFVFLQQAGRDYASTRIISHFLLNCGLRLKVAQVARIVGVGRTTVSRQN